MHRKVNLLLVVCDVAACTCELPDCDNLMSDFLALGPHVIPHQLPIHTIL